MIFSRSFPRGLRDRRASCSASAPRAPRFGVLIGTVTRATPPERRSQTVGLVAAAGSLGTFVIAPLGGWLIDGFGWKSAMVVFAVLAASMALLAMPIRESSRVRAQRERNPSSREALREAIGHRGYLFMTLAFFACGFQLVFITTHLPAYLQLCGVAPGVGATALGLIGLFNAIGTYIFGLLGARYSQKHLLALIYLLRTLFIVRVPAGAGERRHHAGLRLGDGLPLARRRAAGHRHHRPRVRPARTSTRSTAWCS